jgi:hypothetical protein
VALERLFGLLEARQRLHRQGRQHAGGGQGDHQVRHRDSVAFPSSTHDRTSLEMENNESLLIHPRIVKIVNNRKPSG